MVFKNWWFLEVCSFPRGLFLVPMLFFPGCFIDFMAWLRAVPFKALFGTFLWRHFGVQQNFSTNLLNKIRWKIEASFPSVEVSHVSKFQTNFWNLFLEKNMFNLTFAFLCYLSSPSRLTPMSFQACKLHDLYYTLTWKPLVFFILKR